MVVYNNEIKKKDKLKLILFNVNEINNYKIDGEMSLA